MDKKYYIYVAIGIIIAIALSLYIGNEIGKKDQKDVQIRTEIREVQVESEKAKAKIDSLNGLVKSLSKKDKVLKKEEIIVREKAKEIIITKPDNPECDNLYDKATEKIALLETTIVIKDSIETNLRNHIRLQDNIIMQKDQIISNKDKEIALNKQLAKPRNKKWSVGIQVGTGAGVSQVNSTIQVKQIPVYVGIGLSRHLFSF